MQEIGKHISSGGTGLISGHRLFEQAVLAGLHWEGALKTPSDSHVMPIGDHHTAKELPHPQVWVALGLVKLNPPPIRAVLKSSCIP